MWIKTLCTLVSILGILVFTPLYGQRSLLKNILSIEDGLPKSQIYDLQQDQRGFLWIGTRDGLIRYDGTEAMIFNVKNGNLPINYCYNLFLDDEDVLWIASNADYQGICKFDTRTHEYQQYLSNSNDASLGPINNGITSLNQLNDSTLIFTTKDFQLSLLNLETEHFTHVNLNKHMQPNREVVHVSDIMPNPQNPDKVIITCSAGIYEFDLKKSLFSQTLTALDWSPLKMIFSPDHAPYLWVACGERGGLLKLKIADFNQSKLFHPTGIKEANSTAMLSNAELPIFSASNIAFKNDREIWFPELNKGLGIFDINTSTFHFDEFNPSVINEDWTNAIFVNNNGEVWLGTDKTGISYFNGRNNPLRLLFLDPLYPDQQLIVSSIINISEDEYGISIHKNPDLLSYNQPNQEINARYTAPNGEYINDLLKLGSTIYYAGNSSFGVLQKGFSFEALRLLESTNVGINNYMRLTQDRLGQIWMINWGFGLNMYNGKQYNFPGIASSDGIKNAWNHDITIGPAGNVWVGSQNGLYKIDPETQIIECLAHSDSLNGLHNANIKSLIFDDEATLWLTSFGQGLTGITFTGKNLQTKFQFNSRNGLPSDRIYDLIKDRNGNIWMWTNEGLCVLQKIDTKISITYFEDTRDLPVHKTGTWFNLLDNGDISFGFINGFCVFDPNELIGSKINSTLIPIITSFTSLSDGGNIASAIKDHQVQLNPKQNQFNIQFSSPTFSNTHQLQYRYKLEGLNDDWVFNKSKQVNYTNVPSGSYVFHLEVADESQKWQALQSPLQIFIKTIWYKTTAAKVLWSLLVSLLLLAIYRFFLSKQKIQEALHYQAKEAKNLRQLNQIKSNFFTQISHEFRTPLSIILGMADHIKGRANHKIDLNGELETIEDNAHVLLNEINKILDLSKLESNSIKLNFQHGNIVTYIKFLVDSFASFLEVKNTKLDLQSEKSEILMDFDAEIISNIVNNLISNSIKFSAEGSLIKVVIYEQAEELIIMVSDNGPGISEEDAQYIFDPYYRGKDSSNIPGSGLGLALVKNWAQAIGGDISLEFSKSPGTTFKINIPIIKSEGVPKFNELSISNKEHKLLNNSHETAEVESLLKAPTLLIVEDHAQMANYLRMTLSKQYQCIEAHNGREGLKIAINQIPDIIISDVMMPFMNGYELVQEIKSNALTDHIPIILLTAKADQDSKIEGLQFGADAYLTKPFNKNELLLTLRNLFNLRLKNQQRFQQDLQINQIENITKQDHPLIAKLNDLILEQSNDLLSVEKLAGELNMSRSQLYRKVKAISGLSISRYIRQVRLKRAYTLLQNSTMNVSEVAYEVGYSDPNYFSRIFTEEYKKTPSEIINR